jgi:hypothetical protein
MADSEYVQLAKRWILEPLQCATFLVGLIQEFESLFTLEYEPEADGEFTATVEKTKRYRRSLATSLSKNIKLAEKALTLCNEQKSDVFRLDAQWQEAFCDLEKWIILRNMSGVFGQNSVNDAENILANAFIAFRHVVTNLNDRIAVSSQVATKAKRTTTKGDQMRKDAQRLKKQGLSNVEIALRLKCSKSHVTGLLKVPRE